VKAVLDPAHYKDGAWNLLELLDVAFATPEGGDWEPWIIGSAAERARQEERAAKKAELEERKRIEEELSFWRR
jgi:hypothetical protein